MPKRKWDDVSLAAMQAIITMLVEDHAVAAIQGEPDSVVDLGCGTGSVLEKVVDKFTGIRAVAVDKDLSQFGLGELSNVQTTKCDLAQGTGLPDSSFELVLLCGSLEFNDNLGVAAILGEANRIAAPGARIVIQVTHRDHDRARQQLLRKGDIVPSGEAIRAWGEGPYGWYHLREDGEYARLIAKEFAVVNPEVLRVSDCPETLEYFEEYCGYPGFSLNSGLSETFVCRSKH